MHAELKQAMLYTISECEAKGLSRRRVCSLIQIDERRVRNWFSRKDLADSKPGPRHAPHALLPDEREAILEVACDEAYADDSHRVLTAKCLDSGRLAASPSTVYRVMRDAKLTTDRSHRTRGRGGRSKPERPELTGPNQRWCWDISYLRTAVPGEFLYLYVLLDEYSRKVVAFRVSWSMTNAEAKELVEEGIERESLTPEQIRELMLFNDRGTQMKAKPFKRFLKELGITQRFARPRTPNDNPFVESLFSTVKCISSYPEQFVDDMEAVAYFTAFFCFYNNDRLHGEIGYVTPSQRHEGLDEGIIEGRKSKLVQARIRRLEINRIENIVAVRNDEEAYQFANAV